MKNNFLLFSALFLSGASAMAQNPVISAMYTPDPAPYVHDGKVYLFVDQDEDDAVYFKMKDWVLFSTEDMVNWTYLGTPVSTATFSWAAQGDRAWAAQAVEYKGKWYWYLCCNTADGKDALAVAVADKPTGPWKDAIGGPLATGFGFIDPTVLIDNDGSPYLFWGNKGFWYGKLNEDMISFANGYKEVPGYTDPKAFGELQSKMDWSIGKERMMTQYEEGPWVTHRGDLYYAVYPAGGVPEYMAYSTAPTVDGPWTFRGRIMDEAENSFTIHGGNINYKGHDYMFYHNGMLPNGGGFRRATAVEEFQFNADGSIPFIPFTKEGVKPVGTINPYNRVEGETMSQSWGVKLDRLAGEEHYVTSIHNGDWIRVREVDFGENGAAELTAAVRNYKSSASVEFFLDKLDGHAFASVNFDGSSMEKTISIHSKAAPKGKHDVYILFRGGDEEFFDFDWWQCSNVSVSEIIKKAEQGDAASQLAYGRLLKTTGNGVEQDWQKAVEMLQRAAYNGNADAQWELGLMYEYANHVTKDASKALAFYRRSAEAGSPIGLYLVAHCYQHGIVVKEDHAVSDSLYAKSFDLLMQLAPAEDIYVLNFVGSAYYWGDGVKPDRAKAFVYYLTSAQKGNPETQYKIGNCYETGQGTSKDMTQALFWYQKSAAQGYPEALDALARLK